MDDPAPCRDALRHIFDAYRGQVASARALMECRASTARSSLVAGAIINSQATERFARALT
ncbi:hypothetical protein [Massilia phosphatilytica]